MLEDQKSYSFYLNNAPGITQCVADLLKQLNLQLCQLAKDTICTTWRSHVNIRCQKDSYSLTSTKRNKQPTYNLLFHRSRIETVAILKWSENLHIKHFYFLQIIVKLKKCCTVNCLRDGHVWYVQRDVLLIDSQIKGVRKGVGFFWLFKFFGLIFVQGVPRGLQPIRVIPGCLEDVPRMFRGVPGVSRGVQGCSWLVPGFKDTLQSILSN